MTTAAEVVGLQADTVSQLHRPDPKYPGESYTIDIAVGGGLGRYTVPRSMMGNVLAEMTKSGSHADGSIASLAVPMITYGLKQARAYRVQENMTAVIVERADRMRNSTLVLHDIEPPRPNGFVWFEEPVPTVMMSTDTPTLDDIGFSAASWSFVADAPNHRAQRAMWLVVLWADVHRIEWSGFDGDQHLPNVRLCPFGVRLLEAGSRVGSRRLIPSDSAPTNAAPVRNPDRVMLALWEMLGETIPARDDGRHVAQQTEELARTDARRARAHGLQESDVTTVVLRRQALPVQHPGSGRPREWRVWVEPYTARRWVGSKARGDRRLVRRTIAGHWSAPEDRPVRQRTIVSELRR